MSKQYIAGVYNYCDTYCQRCRFSARCHVANEQLDSTLEEIADDAVHKSTQKTTDEILDETQKMLEEIAKALGITVEELQNMTEENMAKLNETMFGDADTDTPTSDQLNHPTFEAALALMEMINDEIENESIDNDQPHIGTIILMIREGLLVKTMTRQDFEHTLYHIESILWYHTAFAAKVGRALEGLAHPDEDDDPIQNDANGSAKAVMNIIEQLTEALKYIQNRHNVQLQQILTRAEELSNTITALFPNYKKFIRPGFDTDV